MEASNLYFRKTKRDIPSSLAMDDEVLELLAAIEDEKDIKKVSQKVKISRAVFKKNFLKLVNLGLIEKLDPEEIYTNNETVQKMRDMLNEIDGLLGDIVLDDTAEMLDMDLNRIPLHELAFFVENLADKIPSEKNRYTFKVWMFEEMKAMGC